MDVRKYASQYIKDVNSRILEFGPLTRCLLDRKKYNNYFFADIRSTEEVKKLYLGNEYLKRTGLHVDTSEVINIDYVVKGSYKETFKKVEKFDYVIVSHVLEHIPNLLDFFIDVQNILKSRGEIIILYPDRRFCFDHFRTDSKFADIYDFWNKNEPFPNSQVLDFYSNVLSENRPQIFWSQNLLKVLESKGTEKSDLEIYQSAKNGIVEDDVHYWPFSDFAFLKFLYDCKRYNIFPFSLKKFIPTQENTQQFLVIISNIDNQNLAKIKEFMIEAKNGESVISEILESGRSNTYISENNLLNSKVKELENDVNHLNQQLELIISEYRESQRFRALIAQIIKKSFILIKRIILFIPKRIIRNEK